MTDADFTREIMTRIARLEENTPQLRQGVMDGDSAVVIGGAVNSLPAAVISGSASDGQRVSVLQARNHALPIVMGPHEAPDPPPPPTWDDVSDGAEQVYSPKGNFEVNWGTASWVLSAANSTTTTVSHGLTDTPNVVFLTGGNNALAYEWNVPAANLTGSTFRADVVHPAGSSVSITIGFYWLAIREI